MRVRGARSLLAGVLGAVLVSAAAALPSLPVSHATSRAAAQAAVMPPLVSLDLRYAADGDRAHRLDLFVPGGHATPRPLVIFIHGGSWTHGSKRVLSGGTSQHTERFRDRLLRNGYAVASVEYRFSQSARFPAQLHDVKAATRFLRSQAHRFHLDSTRFAVAGESAGGHLAQMLGYTSYTTHPWLEGDVGVTGVSSAVSAVVSYYGVSDLSRIVPDRREQRCPPGESGVSSSEGRLIGVDPQSYRHRDVVRAASPMSYVNVSSRPTLLLHGTRDCLVPQQQSVRLYRALQSAGVTTQYIGVNAAHGGRLFHSLPKVSSQVVSFLDAELHVRR